MDTRSSAKGWAVQALAEFIGTAMFLYLAVGGADAVTRGDFSGYLATSFAFGIGLVVTAWAFFRISGSHFNPAISLSSLITGHITVPQFVLYFISQILGAMVGVALARGTTPSTEGTGFGQVNALMNGESVARGFFLEFFLTTILCFVYHMTVHEKNRSTFMAALPYGLALFSCYLFATRYTNASINPARAFAVSVVARSFPRDHWIFWFGPLCGAILAAGLHILFRYVDYDHYSAGIDAENQAQYMRAQAAYNNPDMVHHNVHGAPNSHVNHGPNGTTTTATTNSGVIAN
ncbi:hypothetical protein BGZ67_007612 [Mortierella alpina]|nr:hypothetical protein BGZ67_007612 [Mortierella alpina]